MKYKLSDQYRFIVWPKQVTSSLIPVFNSALLTSSTQKKFWFVLLIAVALHSRTANDRRPLNICIMNEQINDRTKWYHLPSSQKYWNVTRLSVDNIKKINSMCKHYSYNFFIFSFRLCQFKKQLWYRNGKNLNL